MFQSNLVYEIKYDLCSVNFVSNVMACMRKCGKIRYNHRSYRWYYNKTHAIWMLNSYGYRHILRICNTYCFSVAKMVMWTRLIGTLYRSDLNAHERNWPTSTPRWCYLNLLLYKYIACLFVCYCFAIVRESITPAFHQLRCAVDLKL